MTQLADKEQIPGKTEEELQEAAEKLRRAVQEKKEMLKRTARPIKPAYPGIISQLWRMRR